jgi:hypothetical protein
MVEFSINTNSIRWNKSIGPRVYRFPINSQDDYKGTIKFSVMRTDYASAGKKVAEQLQVIGDPEFIVGTTFPGYQSSLQTQRSDIIRPKKTGDSVTLYLPTSIVFNDVVDYGQSEMGVSGAATAAALQGGSNYIGAAASALSNIVPSFTSIYDAATSGAQSDAATIAMLRTIGRVSQPVRTAVETTTGLTLNPNKRSTLTGVGIRNFNFTFKLIPESRKEAREIEYIINLFRSEIYPEDYIAGGLPIGYRYPNKFAIEMFYDNKPVATKILPSFLQNFTTNYNPNSMSFHDDGKFPEIDISMGFMEDRTLRKQDVQDNGY